MAAKADTGIFFDGANSGCVAQDMFYGSTKFHSFMTKCTIVSYFSHIRLTINVVLSLILLGFFTHRFFLFVCF